MSSSAQGSTAVSEIRGTLGLITLNSPVTLNALTLEMFRAIDQALDRFEADPAIQLVVFRGEGPRSFCAGGDVKRVTRETANAHQYARDFFETEYKVDHRIYTYPKPVVVLAHGIVMGGGIGLMMGAPFRAITEKSILAMPEISIGLYPDVGATHFLSRLPGRLGLFLGLTAARLNSSDARQWGFADFVVKDADRETILDELTHATWTSNPISDQANIRTILQSFDAPAADLPALQVQPRLAEIESLCQGEMIQEIGRNLSTAQSSSDPWIAESAKAFMQGSPTSAALIFEAWKRGRSLDLAQCFDLEYSLSMRCVAHPDFTEGVRARLIDKDQKPRWTPPTLDEVTPAWVSEHFQPLPRVRPRG